MSGAKASLGNAYKFGVVRMLELLRYVAEAEVRRERDRSAEHALATGGEVGSVSRRSAVSC